MKLGAGGLVRAYGGAARDCLRSAPKHHVTPKTALRLQVCVRACVCMLQCIVFSPGPSSEQVELCR